MSNFINNIDPALMNWVIIPIVICLARIIDVSIGTLRIIFVSRGFKYLAPLLGFVEVLIWLLAIGQIMQNLTNPVNYIAYASGFAIGNYIGMLIENKLAMGVVLVRVITKKSASDLIKNLRETGLTVTSIDAEGNYGDVKVFFTIVNRKQLKSVLETVHYFNPLAFYTVEDIGYAKKGYSPTTKQRQKLMEMISLKRR